VIASWITLAVLAQGYARSHMSDTDNSTQCLWWKEGSSIVYRQSTPGNDETPGDTEFTAVNAAFATWQTELAACASLSFSEGSRTTNRNAEYLERGDVPNQNVVVFRQRTCKQAAPAQDPCFADGSCANKYDCWQFSAGAIAITTTSFSPKNAQIFDSDIELNTPSYFFSTVDSPPCAVGMESVNCVASDVQNTMTHEIGHLLGLGHYASDPASTMAPRAVTGELSKRTLDPGSKKFLCDIYPKGKPSKLCFIPALSVEKGPVAKTGCSSTGAELSPVLLLLARRRRRGL
jgi:hypothetical protein